MRRLKGCAAAGLLWTLSVCAAGCGAGTDVSKFTENTVAVNKDGSITELAVESFGEDYYSQDALEAYVNAQVEAYNREHPADSGKEKDKTITVDEISVKDDSARVVLTYETAQDYADFNYTQLELVEASDISGDAAGLSFKDTQGSETGSLSAIPDIADYEAVVTYTAHNIAVPGKIAYVSSNVTLLDRSSAQSDGTLSVVLYR